MGIRFRCHHCQYELHVKDFQAGKRGRCPECKGRFRIPPADAAHSLDIDSDVTESSIPTDSQPDASKPTDFQPDAPQTAAEQTRLPELLSPASPISKTAAVGQPAGEVIATEPPLVAAELSQPPALTDAPNAKWFVRPTSGGQFGPAAGDIMWQWLNENRVGRDALVWCEGWDDWLVASQVFAEFYDAPTNSAPTSNAPTHSDPANNPVASSGAVLTDRSPTIAPGAPATQPSLSDRNRLSRKQRRRRNYTILIAVLSVVMVLLVSTLVAVLMLQE